MQRGCGREASADRNTFIATTMSSVMQRLLHLAVALAATLAICTASAHTVDKGLATISVEGQSVHYHLLLAVSAVTPQGGMGVDLGPSGAPPDYSLLLKA